MKSVFSPRRGFSTGACAAAAAKAAAYFLYGKPVKTASLFLPWNSPGAVEVEFSIVNPKIGEGWACCGVVKDAGDDPDVTNGLEITAAVHCLKSVPETVSLPNVSSTEDSISIFIEGGEGVGTVTKAGLAPAVGESAINPIPREMIKRSVLEALRDVKDRTEKIFKVVVSIPGGEEVAKKTLNGRLGILGGLSILGTTGIVIPTSIDAWKAAIDASLDVALASGLRKVVLSVGRSSEAAAQLLFSDLPPEAFVLIGDHAGYAIKASASRGLKIILAGQFAKFCKIASGLQDTNVREAWLNPEFMRKILLDAGFSGFDAVLNKKRVSARRIMETLLKDDDRGVFSAITEKVAGFAETLAGEEVGAVLFDYGKNCLARRSV